MPAYTTRPPEAATTGAPFLPPMSMPFVASVNPERTLPFTGQIQSMASSAVPVALSGADGAGAGVAGAGVAAGPVAGAAGEAGAGTGAAPGGDSPAESCARFLSEYGTRWPRGSTFSLSVFASGRDSTIGPFEARGVATGVAIGAAPAGAASTSDWPTLMTLGLAMPFQAASSR